MKEFKIKNLKLKILTKQSGMTLFMAVTIMAILLFISFAVVNIAIKSTTFANLGKESQYAFYAADAGIECAIYWDRFTPSKFDIDTPGSPIFCADLTPISTGGAIPGTSTTAFIGGGGPGNRTSRFGFNLNQGSNPMPYCAIVTVTKNADGTTYIKSRGYNTCDTNHPRRIERGVEVTY